MRDWSKCQETRNKLAMTAAKYIPIAEDRMIELRDIVSDIRRPKSVREEALRELRPLERELGYEETYPKGYNRGQA